MLIITLGCFTCFKLLAFFINSIIELNNYNSSFTRSILFLSNAYVFTGVYNIQGLLVQSTDYITTY